MIEVESLVKAYGTQKAVNNVTFSVPKGQILGFLGPNGAGKTTTMRVLTGYLAPTSGSASIAGYDVVTQSLEARRKVGYLPESAPLYPDMNVVDYLQFVAEIRQINGSARRDRIREMVEVCGLEEVIQKDIGQLSKGYRQRVGLAQAMIHHPDVLILDEPTSGLDPNQIVEIRSLIREIGREHTVILSTHILPEVQATCDRVLIINRGQLVADGTPEELQAAAQGAERVRIEAKISSPDDAVEALRELEAVESVKWVSDANAEVAAFEIEAEKGSDIRESIFHLAVDKGWVLLEMHRDQVSLESVFHNLTQSEPALDD
ncbi:MAG: ATP-binding cassette domain-containing protein [Gemmatimonadetes bacterium]|nr:MAG: ATP-binding cassette domain-containing protein [Gemmatimonadota bacterium]